MANDTKEKERKGKGGKAEEPSILTYGLTNDEAAKRLEKYGENRPFQKAQLDILSIFLDHFQLPTILLLFAIIFLLTVEFVPALVSLGFILGMIIGETTRDLQIREAVRAMRERHISHVMVIREGIRKTISVSELVLGDLLLLFPGMRVPADGRIIQSKCKVDEGIFDRGIVEKRREEKLEEKALPAFGIKEDEGKKEYFLLYAGTFIAEGECIMRVEKTGTATKYAGTIEKGTGKPYAIVEKIGEVTDRLSNMMLGIALVIFIVLLFYKTPFLGALSVAAAAAVAGTPASILLSARVAFFSSIKRIEGLAIRKDDLPERLSNITMICTEKVKALSLGEPTVRKIWLDRENIEVSGEGWSRAGRFRGMNDYAALDFLSETAIIATSAVPVYRENGEFYFTETDLREGALVTMAMKNNMSTETLRNENYCIEQKTNPETGIVTSVHVNPKRERVTYIRGAAKDIAEMCDFIHVGGKKKKISDELKKEIEYKKIEIAADGFSPYAIAYSTEEKGKTKYVLLAVLGIYDPPKPEVKKIIDECKTAGIKIVIITEETGSAAVEFARQLDILTSNTRALLCDQLKFLRDPERKETIKKTVVFASATSEYKKMIIDEFKSMGEKVLFVDSGVADLSALKSADVSISLESATEASRYNADAILLNDNFYWVPKSIEESKALADVVIRSFYSLFISDFAIIFLVLLSAVLMTKTMNILQILAVNLIADSLIGIGLAMDRSKHSALTKKIQFPSKMDFAFSLFLAVYISVVVFLIADYFPDIYFSSIATAGIVLCSVANTLNFSSSDSIFRSRPSWRIILAMAASIVFLFFMTYMPVAQVIFGMFALQPQQWGLLLMVAVSIIFIMEIKKLVK